MSYNYSIEKLLEIQEVSEIKIKNNEKNKEIYITLNRKEHNCPNCGTKTDKIHDYRRQRIKDIKILCKDTVIILKKRRYICPHCKKRFYENISWLPRYARMTQRTYVAIIDDLRKVKTYKEVGEEYGVSGSTVARIFDNVEYIKPKLPNVLSIDEFKGNAGGEKYNCIIADPLKHRVLDILPKRYDWYIQDYFLKYSKEERARVQVFISDMWKPYQETAKQLFKESTGVIDKYHWYRQIVWAFEKVRKEAQKKLSPEYRRYFKRSRSILLKRFNTLSDEDKQAVNVMLYASADISSAYYYKEKFQEIIRMDSRAKAKEAMDEWIASAAECGIKPIQDCAKTMRNWKTQILNSFTTSCTNGFIEGCNNKIKVQRRIGYGYRNFKRFRNRILHIFSETHPQTS